MTAQTIQNIQAYAATIKMAYTKEAIEEFVLEVIANDYSFDKALEVLLERECEKRRINGVIRRITRARFPYQITFDTFFREHLPANIRREIKLLETLQFLEDRSNIVLIGNPGVGKTALSVALGTKACEKGKTVCFVNISNLVIDIKEAMSLNQLTSYKRAFEKYDLVILDDLGYCSFNKECGEVLFNLLSNRNEKGSMIITTNLSFDRWNEVFQEPVLTGAIVDRIAHKAHVIDMTGKSYRVLETKEWLENKES